MVSDGANAPNFRAMTRETYRRLRQMDDTPYDAAMVVLRRDGHDPFGLGLEALGLLLDGLWRELGYRSDLEGYEGVSDRRG